MIYNNFSGITRFSSKIFQELPTPLRIKSKLFTITSKSLCAMTTPASFQPHFLTPSSLSLQGDTGLLPVLQKAPSSLLECGRLFLECCSPCPWYVCLFFCPLGLSLLSSSKRSSLTILSKTYFLILSVFHLGYFQRMYHKLSFFTSRVTPTLDCSHTED